MKAREHDSHASDSLIHKVATDCSLGRLSAGSVRNVFVLLLSISSVTMADEARNRLPKKQHKDSDAPFLQPAEAVA